MNKFFEFFFSKGLFNEVLQEWPLNHPTKAWI